MIGRTWCWVICYLQSSKPKPKNVASRGVLAKLKIKKSLLHGEGIFAYGDVAVVDVEVEGAVVDVDDVAGPLVLVAAVPPPITTCT